MLKETDFIKKYIKTIAKQTKYSLNFEDDVAVVWKSTCPYNCSTME